MSPVWAVRSLNGTGPERVKSSLRHTWIHNSTPVPATTLQSGVAKPSDFRPTAMSAAMATMQGPTNANIPAKIWAILQETWNNPPDAFQSTVLGSKFNFQIAVLEQSLLSGAVLDYALLRNSTLAFELDATFREYRQICRFPPLPQVPDIDTSTTGHGAMERLRLLWRSSAMRTSILRYRALLIGRRALSSTCKPLCFNSPRRATSLIHC